VSEELAQAAEALRRIQERQEAARRAARRFPNGKLRPTESRNRFIAETALVREPIPDGHGAEFWITYGGGRERWLRLRESKVAAQLIETVKMCDPDALNGYVAYPKRHAPHLPAGTGHIVQYIPVHGGVTWARKDSFMAVWGFDTMHSNSENQPRTDQDWIRANCWVLYRGLMLAEKRWPEFRRASQSRRAQIADGLLALIEEQPLLEKLGFEATISLLFGRIGGGDAR
jgi:hypothetical protein